MVYIYTCKKKKKNSYKWKRNQFNVINGADFLDDL